MPSLALISLSSGRSLSLGDFVGTDLEIFIVSLELSLFAAAKIFSKVNFSEEVWKVTMASDSNFFPFLCRLISLIDISLSFELWTKNKKSQSQCP